MLRCSSLCMGLVLAGGNWGRVWDAMVFGVGGYWVLGTGGWTVWYGVRFGCGVLSVCSLVPGVKFSTQCQIWSMGY